MISKALFNKYANDPSAFRDSLSVDVSGSVRKFGAVMDDWQREDFALLDPAIQRCNGRSKTPAKMRAYLERGRGASKTHDIAVNAVWTMAFSARPIRGYAFAADKDQAKLLKDAMATLLRLNPWLAQILSVQREGVINIAEGHPGEGGQLSIESSDVASSYGILPDLVVVDEITHWPESAEALWHSIISSSAKRSNALLYVIANAGFTESWQWRIYNAVQEDPNWEFSRLDQQTSWMTPERLEEQRRMLPEVAFKRLWLNQWSSGGGDALTEADVLAAFHEDLEPMTGNEKDHYFIAGCDLGLTRDCSAVIVLAIPRGGKSGKIKLAHHKLWRPIPGKKIDLIEVQKHLLELDQQFGLEHIGFDPWQHELLAQQIEADTRRKQRNRHRLHHRQPFMREIPPSGPNLRQQCSITIESFNDHRFQFYPCEDLRRDLLRLRVEEKSYGYRLTSPRDGRGHGDTFSAFANALLIAHEMAGKKPITLGVFSDTSPISGNRKSPIERAQERIDRENERRREEELEPADDGQDEWRRVMRMLGRA